MLIVIKIIYFSPYCWMANHRLLYFRLIIWSNLPTQKEVVARFYHFHFCHPHGLVLNNDRCYLWQICCLSWWWWQLLSQLLLPLQDQLVHQSLFTTEQFDHNIFVDHLIIRLTKQSDNDDDNYRNCCYLCMTSWSTVGGVGGHSLSLYRTDRPHLRRCPLPRPECQQSSWWSPWS